MSIKCDLCGYEFKTHFVEKPYYNDNYELDTKKIEEPNDDENPAHLIKHYICDKCYQNFSEKVKTCLLNDALNYLGRGQQRRQDAYERYMRDLDWIKKEEAEVIELWEKLNDLQHGAPFSSLPRKDLEKMIGSWWAIPKSTYIDAVLKWEKEMNEENSQKCI